MLLKENPEKSKDLILLGTNASPKRNFQFTFMIQEIGIIQPWPPSPLINNNNNPPDGRRHFFYDLLVEKRGGGVNGILC